MSLPSELAAVVGRVDPQSISNTEKFTDVVDLAKFHACLGVALLGNMAAETIDFKCYYCDSDGTNATALKSATQLAAHATNNDNKQIVIGIRAVELPVTKRYIKFGLVTGGGTGGPSGVIALGLQPRFGPASDDDLSSVVEIKA